MKLPLSPKESLPSRTTWPRPGLTLALTLCLTLWATRATAFSLLGPYTDWMVPTNGYQLPGDIGGPMNLDEEYRWNVPVVTYGFDQSFLDYFGTNGVQAVESAIKILNDLPPASSVVLSNYPLDSRRINFRASAENLLDLKSATLSLLLEQMGLAQPSRNIFELRRFDPVLLAFPSESDWAGWAIPNLIIERNFDPETHAPSHSVNGTLYTGTVMQFPYWGSVSNVATVLETPVDPLALAFPAVADWFPGMQAGEYATGLTRDDVGGLRYLLSKDNVNYESLLSNARSSGPRVAWRPGVEKIKFVRHHFDKRHDRFLPMPVFFIGTYLRDGAVKRQLVKRTILQPDFIFYAGDTGESNSWTPLVVRTDTSHWSNNAAANRSPANAGPGVIQPPVKITFHKLGPTISTGEFPASTIPQAWGTFDNSTNAPIPYPANPRNTNELTLRLRFWNTDVNPGVLLTNKTWHFAVPIGGRITLQISTNQTDWTSLAIVMNDGAVIEWNHYGAGTPQPYFRIMVEAERQPPPTLTRRLRGVISREEQFVMFEAERLRWIHNQGSNGAVLPPPIEFISPAPGSP